MATSAGIEQAFKDGQAAFPGERSAVLTHSALEAMSMVDNPYYANTQQWLAWRAGFYLSWARVNG